MISLKYTEYDDKTLNCQCTEKENVISKEKGKTVESIQGRNRSIDKMIEKFFLSIVTEIC